MSTPVRSSMYTTNDSVNGYFSKGWNSRCNAERGISSGYVLLSNLQVHLNLEIITSA